MDNFESSAHRMGFAANDLARDAETRSEQSLADALAAPGGLYYLKSEEGWLCQAASGTPEPVFSREAASPLVDLGHAVLLGWDAARRPHIAAPLASGRGLAEDVKAIDLRSLAMQAVLSPEVEGRLGQAQHLLLWHGANGFCARCGGKTASEAGGVRRRCTACGDIVFPRINPVTIMLVHDGAGRCILGRQPQFPEHFWSCLAGFVEAGETLDDAVRRETFEEAGVTVGEVAYHSSQPWPFPANLMIGCLALATSTDIVFDGVELEACRWFDRDEVRAMLDGRHPDGLLVPKPFAIAHHLIRAFAEGER
ncbi:NAD+ diphosphatase [Fulvimarina manganoxydans]|uniref:NAD(+) diphosphatase n=1 Tax=Fulvimarina manganoxydans TaxID=937218 RepID=A0A1W1YFN3_9HYPH|nr:NAD(+) diphosphatase [Fulvimarina manganoxydans]SMC34631.1 NAD+ diphosphatase [Fulvimarina manganoxydans]